MRGVGEGIPGHGNTSTGNTELLLFASYEDHFLALISKIIFFFLFTSKGPSQFQLHHWLLINS
jgi:hypothetical protein